LGLVGPPAVSGSPGHRARLACWEASRPLPRRSRTVLFSLQPKRASLRRTWSNKHQRRIWLAEWQQNLAERWPEALIRGLIQSDGRRFINTGAVDGDIPGISSRMSPPTSPASSAPPVTALGSAGRPPSPAMNRRRSRSTSPARTTWRAWTSSSGRRPEAQAAPRNLDLPHGRFRGTAAPARQRVRPACRAASRGAPGLPAHSPGPRPRRAPRGAAAWSPSPPLERSPAGRSRGP
jgi:hypothetical protein